MKPQQIERVYWLGKCYMSERATTWIKARLARIEWGWEEILTRGQEVYLGRIWHKCLPQVRAVMKNAKGARNGIE